MGRICISYWLKSTFSCQSWVAISVLLLLTMLFYFHCPARKKPRLNNGGRIAGVARDDWNGQLCSFWVSNMNCYNVLVIFLLWTNSILANYLCELWNFMVNNIFEWQKNDVATRPNLSISKFVYSKSFSSWISEPFIYLFFTLISQLVINLSSLGGCLSECSFGCRRWPFATPPL